jgi:hypothetical protein
MELQELTDMGIRLLLAAVGIAGGIRVVDDVRTAVAYVRRSQRSE